MSADLAAAEMDQLSELYLEYHYTPHGPFKMLRLDRYFFALEKVIKERRAST